jgi:predicted Zn-dependent protease
MNRRGFIKYIWAAGFFAASPAIAFDIFKALDPQGKNKDVQKAKTIFEGASSIISSATDMDYNSEFAIGESLALEGFKRYGLPSKSKKLQEYVNLVGNSVARNSLRPTISYYFVVVDSPLYNAFACPGGIIFVSSALVKAMNYEADLACVLAHEVAHVGHKHALQSIKRAKFFEGVGKISTVNMKGEDGKKFRDMIGGLQETLFDKGLDQGMEHEADASGMEIAYRTGYNPQGLVRILHMLKKNEEKAEKKGSWFSTHPPLSERISKCQNHLKKYPDANELAEVKNRFAEYRRLL